MDRPDDLITIDARRRDGEPCVRDLRITVGDVLGYLAAGDTVDDVLHHFPYLTEADIRACLAYAARLARSPSAPQGDAA